MQAKPKINSNICMYSGKILRGRFCLLLSIVSREVSASGWSHVGTSADRVVSECDREASKMRRPWPWCWARERWGNLSVRFHCFILLTMECKTRRFAKLDC